MFKKMMAAIALAGAAVAVQANDSRVFNFNDVDWGVAVHGKWAHIDAKGKKVVTGQGAYAHIRANELHADQCVGPKVCINIVDFDGPRDFAFPESSKK